MVVLLTNVMNSWNINTEQTKHTNTWSVVMLTLSNIITINSHVWCHAGTLCDHITTTAKIENIIISIILFESGNMAHTHTNKRQTDRQISCQVIPVKWPDSRYCETCWCSLVWQLFAKQFPSVLLSGILWWVFQGASASNCLLPSWRKTWAARTLIGPMAGFYCLYEAGSSWYWSHDLWHTWHCPKRYGCYDFYC